MGDLARREGTTIGGRPHDGRRFGGRVRLDDPYGARRRGAHRRRGEPRVLVRSVLRVRPTAVGADVGIPRLDRLRLPRRHGRLGGRSRPSDPRGHGRRRIRAVPRGAHHRGEVRHEHHPRAPQQLDRSGRSRRSSEPDSSRCGRRACTTRTSPSTRGSAVHTASASTDADQLDDALTQALAVDGPAMVEVVTDPELV